MEIRDDYLGNIHGYKLTVIHGLKRSPPRSYTPHSSFCGWYHGWATGDSPGPTESSRKKMAEKITCKRCLGVLKQRENGTPTGIVKQCLKRIRSFESAHRAEMAKFNKKIRMMCKYNKGYTSGYRDWPECSYDKGTSQICCLAYCPLR